MRLLSCLSPAVRLQPWLGGYNTATICNLSVTTCRSFLLWFGQRTQDRRRWTWQTLGHPRLLYIIRSFGDKNTWRT